MLVDITHLDVRDLFHNLAVLDLWDLNDPLDGLDDGHLDGALDDLHLPPVHLFRHLPNLWLPYLLQELHLAHLWHFHKVLLHGHLRYLNLALADLNTGLGDLPWDLLKLRFGHFFDEVLIAHLRDLNEPLQLEHLGHLNRTLPPLAHQPLHLLDTLHALLPGHLLHNVGELHLGYLHDLLPEDLHRHLHYILTHLHLRHLHELVHGSHPRRLDEHCPVAIDARHALRCEGALHEGLPERALIHLLRAIGAESCIERRKDALRRADEAGAATVPRHVEPKPAARARTVGPPAHLLGTRGQR
mmetsp:Transcript_7751/g.16205  ORF Transcript_7751/g.16205 Transcript_7751/m.16205 type:complete len:300 (+) Transcript_7751:989-1888(+)